MGNKMFINYDNNINRKFIKPQLPPELPNILDSNPDVQMVYDVFGNEIGVKITRGKAFDLYFYLENFDPAVDLYSLLENSEVCFEIYTANHILVLQKIFSGKDIFNSEEGSLMVSVTNQESLNLALDSYRIKLTLGWPGGFYELYPESAGLLIVR